MNPVPRVDSIITFWKRLWSSAAKNCARITNHRVHNGSGQNLEQRSFLVSQQLLIRAYIFHTHPHVSFVFFSVHPSGYYCVWLAHEDQRMARDAGIRERRILLKRIEKRQRRIRIHAIVLWGKCAFRVGYVGQAEVGGISEPGREGPERHEDSNNRMATITFHFDKQTWPNCKLTLGRMEKSVDGRRETLTENVSRIRRKKCNEKRGKVLRECWIDGNREGGNFSSFHSILRFWAVWFRWSFWYMPKTRHLSKGDWLWLITA